MLEETVVQLWWSYLHIPRKVRNTESELAIFKATIVEAAATSFGELTMCFPERLLAFSPLHYGNGEKALANCLFSD